ncbi:MAG: tetratricopeptide repeat protein [Methylobacter sp.]
MKQWFIQGWIGLSFEKQLSIIAAIFVAVVGAGWAVFEHVSGQPDKPVSAINLIDQGNGFLSSGQYAEAKKSFSEAQKNDNQDSDAAWGLKKAELWETKTPEAFEQNLQQLYAENPQDAHVNLYYGKLYGAKHEHNKALPYYRTALELNPALAEAHFDLGVLYEQQNKPVEAQAEYEQAVALRAMPKYQSNLADLFFYRKDYDRAFELYGKISNYPLSALQLAKIYWIKGELQQAESLQRLALQLLDNDLNVEPWYFAIGHNVGLDLTQAADKKDYAHLCVSASLFLQGREVEAKTELEKLSPIGQVDIKSIVTADLSRLALANDDFEQQVAAYVGMLSARR